MSATGARSLAREVVTKVRERDAFAHEVMDARLRESRLIGAERSLATRLAYGTIQTRGTLVEAIRRHMKSSRLESKVEDALCIAAYELLFSATEPRAAVHQGVELVRAVRPQAAALANAILRKIAEERARFPWGDPSTDVDALARLYGHPSWLAQMWVSELGRDTAAELMAANNEPAPLYLAANVFVASDEEAFALLESDGADPRRCELPGCVRADNPSHAVRGSALRAGAVVVCDLGAQVVVGLMRVAPRQRLAEIGSGRGTKTILLQGAALRRGGHALITAIDSHSFKADVLARRVAELRVPGISVAVGDARDIASIPGLPPPGSLDSILVDAPCSGLGTLRRHPEKRWRVTPDDVCALGQLGSQLLEQASVLVRPGGFVVYSTCTITNQENAAVVGSFLAGERGLGFSADALADDIPVALRQFVGEQGYFASYPVLGGPDGHFAARLIRGVGDA
jgi:16S rRNA (cytosine967-C5)-methyltransferase